MCGRDVLSLFSAPKESATNFRLESTSFLSGGGVGKLARVVKWSSLWLCFFFYYFLNFSDINVW